MSVRLPLAYLWKIIRMNHNLTAVEEKTRYKSVLTIFHPQIIKALTLSRRYCVMQISLLIFMEGDKQQILQSLSVSSYRLNLNQFLLTPVSGTAFTNQKERIHLISNSINSAYAWSVVVAHVKHKPVQKIDVKTTSRVRGHHGEGGAGEHG